MKISEKIYKLRTDLGLSQKELAEQVGTSQSAINYWENGKRQPRMSQIKKIAVAFKLPLYALTDDDFELWDLSNELENKRARLINPSDPTKYPGSAHFTSPIPSENTQQLVDSSADDDLEYIKSLMPNISPDLRERFAKAILALNEEQLELISKIATALANDSEHDDN